MKAFDRAYRYYDSFMKLFKLYKVNDIREVLNLKGRETIVDIGGGTGYLAKHLYNDCDKIYVLDESKKMLSRIKKEDNIMPLLGNALSTDFEQGSIDVVILSDVLHHIKDQIRLMEEINRILKCGGRLLIMDFEKNHFKTKMLRLFEFIVFGKLYYKTHSQAINLLKKYFKIEQDKIKGYYYIIVGSKKC